jgi:peptidoglycan/xylan/chitin deacetylase (PgdA/CDA1 family)
LAAILAALALVPAGAVRAQAVAITFDDLPAHSALPPGETRLDVAEAILAALRAAGVRKVTGFVNGAQLEREPDSAPVLDLWRRAGHPLGNHTWSHADLDAVGPQAFEADIARDEPLLAGQVRWLRFPFLHEGAATQDRAEVRRWLADRGYGVASVTLSFDDWAFNAPYARCLAKGDAAAAAELERRYLEWARASLAYSRGLARTLYGRDIPYVLLMHLGALDARMLPRLLADYRAAGVRFVTLDEAEADPFYAADRTAAPSDAPATLEAELRRRNLPVPPKPWDPATLDAVCR